MFFKLEETEKHRLNSLTKFILIDNTGLQSTYYNYYIHKEIFIITSLLLVLLKYKEKNTKKHNLQGKKPYMQ